MRSKNRGYIELFIDWADQTEGMRFLLTEKYGVYEAKPDKTRNYNPAIVGAVIRNFRSDFGPAPR